MTEWRPFVDPLYQPFDFPRRSKVENGRWFNWRSKEPDRRLYTVLDEHQRVIGSLHTQADSGVLVLDASGSSLPLRFAFSFLGKEELIFPEVLLDDWGHERKDLGLYRWIEENGFQFPRAELFGYDLEGTERQCFLRELDLQSKLPCYCFKDLEEALENGIRLNCVVVLRNNLLQPERILDLQQFELPLRNASLSWWASSAASAERLVRDLLGS